MAMMIWKRKMREREEDKNGPEPEAKRAKVSPEPSELAASEENQLALVNAPAGLPGPEAVAPSVQNQLALVNAPPVSFDACFNYAQLVTEYFKDDRQKQTEFFTVLKDFMARRVDNAGTIDRLKELFQNHRHLILPFNEFLPEDQKIPLPEEEQLDKKQEATSIFKHKIKALGQDVYQEYGEILQLYQQRKKTINEVYQYAAARLVDHSDLLAEFRTFLPDVNISTIPTSSDKMPVVVPARSPLKLKIVVCGKRSITCRENPVAKATGEISGHCEPEGSVAKARKIKEKIVDKTQQLALAKALQKNEKIGKIEEDMEGLYKKQKTTPRREEPSLRGRNKEASSVPDTESLQSQRMSARNLAKRAPLQSFSRGDGDELPSLAEVEQRTENCWHKWKGW